MLSIYLIEPLIPQNTGNIGRLALALNAKLIIVGKPGFSLDEKYLKKAGMDYWKRVNLELITLEMFMDSIAHQVSYISTKTTKIYTEIPQTSTSIAFGNESYGLPKDIYKKYNQNLFRIPMAKNVRSLNLATSVGIVAYHLASKNFQNYFVS